MKTAIGPLVTQAVHEQLTSARDRQQPVVRCSLDLGRSECEVWIGADRWGLDTLSYPYLDVCKARTIYHWADDAFAPVARYDQSLIKLVPTEWGAPTFEIDGIKMLPTARVSPYEDARQKVELIAPRDKVILDTCGGLGYFAAWCLQGQAKRVLSFEKDETVLWLRKHNPWSPDEGNGSRDGSGDADGRVLTVTQGDVIDHIAALPTAGMDAVLHDPPRFGIAGDLYSRSFYEQLARVLRPRGRLFHYTGAPNRLTSRRDVPNEVRRRLESAGFDTELSGDGVLATRRGK